MREIKFRALNKNSKTFIYSDWKYGFVSFWDNVCHDTDFENPQQYTGLKDKNGKEIYEGDIVKWYINGLERIAPIYYDELAACFWMGKDLETYSLVLNDWMRGEYEILGNIYENPDLLSIEPNVQASVATEDDSSNKAD